MRSFKNFKYQHHEPKNRDKPHNGRKKNFVQKYMHFAHQIRILVKLRRSIVHHNMI